MKNDSARHSHGGWAEPGSAVTFFALASYYSQSDEAHRTPRKEQGFAEKRSA